MASLSIRARLLLLVTALALPFGAFIAYELHADVRQREAHARESLRTLVQMMVTNTGSRIMQAKQTLERLAARPHVKLVDAGRCEPLLRELHQFNPAYSNIVYTDMDGVAVCSAVAQPGGRPVNVGATPWFQRFRKEMRFVVGQPHIGPITGKWVSVMSVPIRDDAGTPVGAVHLPLDLAAHDPGIPTQFLPAGTRYGFFDTDGILVWRNLDPEKVIGTRPNADAARRIVELRDGEFEAVAVDGVTRFFSVAPIPGTEWIAFAGVPSESIYGDIRRNALYAAALALAALAVLVAVALVIARGIARPVAALARTAHAVHLGNDTAEAAIDGPREVAIVAAEFNGMLAAQRDRDAQLCAFLDNSAVVAWLKDVDGRYVFASDNFLARFSFTAEQVIGSTDEALWPPAVADEFRRNDAALLAGGQAIEVTEPAIEADGRTSWWLVKKFIFVDARGQRFLGGLAVDITERRQAEAETLASRDRLNAILQTTRDAYWLIDMEGRLRDVNAAACELLGYRREDLLSKSIGDIEAQQDEELIARTIESIVRRGAARFETRHWTADGRRLEVEVSVTHLRSESLMVAFIRDIGERRAHQRQLEHVVHFDRLTDLPNRVLLADRLYQAMAQALRRGKLLAVVYLDLDGFKGLNDRFGHETGDAFLTRLAVRMRDALRDGDTLARMGGDEFVAVLLDLPEHEASVPILDRLLASAATPVTMDGRELQVSASMGVTFFPQAEGMDADQLLRQADQAMYQAKQAGKNRYHVFDAQHDRSVRSHHENLERIRTALADGELRLYYQPKVNMRSGQVVGAEALIRWQHPERGLLPPGAFLPVIENHPLSVEVGEWVLETALRQIGAWSSAGLGLQVSVNIDALQLEQPDFVARLEARLAAHPGVAAGGLELEVLETSALDDVERIAGIMFSCRRLGVGFALDDFGTGYSSLTYLKRLPVSLLKIDQSFVRGLLDDPEDLAILDGVLGLAGAFRRQVIAEGVETTAHGELLLQMGCELGQGYAIARPMPADALPAWVRQWRPDAAWLNRPPVRRDDRPVLAAVIEHRAWVAELGRALRDGQDAPLIRQSCRFTDWLNREGALHHSAQPGFRQALSLHDQLHRRGTELLDLGWHGQAELALARYAEVEALRDELLAALAGLMA